eukprot:2096903-Prymnesium_polylepis.1
MQGLAPGVAGTRGGEPTSTLGGCGCGGGACGGGSSGVGGGGTGGGGGGGGGSGGALSRSASMPVVAAQERRAAYVRPDGSIKVAESERLNSMLALQAYGTPP